MGSTDAGAVLDAMSLAGWVHLGSERSPGRRRRTIDHLVVGPGGVFVIDSVDWAGDVAVRDDVLQPSGRRQERAVAGCVDAALAVRGIVPAYAHDQVTALLCVGGDDPLTGTVGDVLVTSTASLDQVLLGTPRVFSDDQVHDVVRRISAGLPAALARPRRPEAQHGAHRRDTRRPRRMAAIPGRHVA